MACPKCGVYRVSEMRAGLDFWVCQNPSCRDAVLVKPSRKSKRIPQGSAVPDKPQVQKEENAPLPPTKNPTRKEVTPPVSAAPLRQEAEALLRTMLGSEDAFREGQFEAIQDLVERRSRMLLVQRTGWGKSYVYFIATALLRKRGAGLTLLISPLLSLMRNQIDAARRAGIRAYTINSTNREDWAIVEEVIRRDQCDILLISPERLANVGFQGLGLESKLGMLVIDEAHCISDWGHDFRPDYRRIVRWAAKLKAGIPILATTATANSRVVEDVRAQLGGKPSVMRGPLARESLRLFQFPEHNQAWRLAWLAANLPLIPGHGIIYCLTVRNAETIAGWLNESGIPSAAYHADLSNQRREELEKALLENKLKALVATVALGMGFDKPDLGFVIHFQRPGSVVAYYQQIGRAGRKLPEALVVLLAGPEDREINRHFIESAFPPPDSVRQVLASIVESPKKRSELLRNVNIAPKVLDQVLKHLELEGAISQASRRYSAADPGWKMDEDRISGVLERRRLELKQIEVGYPSHAGCLMQFLLGALDDSSAEPCGRCQNCRGKGLDTRLQTDMLERAGSYLQSQAIIIRPRKQWPAGIAEGVSRIPTGQRLQEGRALTYYADSGLGKLVQTGKYRDNRFADELVEAAARLVAEKWRPSISWVTAIPSLRHPDLVPNFAQRLATRLALPFRQVLVRARDAAEQKSMENSYMQASNVLNSLIVEGEFPPGGALLVDDMIDSGWTMTAACSLLTSKGVPEVFPFALAMTRSGG